MIAAKVIYENPQQDFFTDVNTERIADIISQNFERFSGHRISRSEYRSWDNSLQKIKNVIELSGLSDLHVAFEYQIPYTQRRIDCLIFGKDSNDKGNVMHIELKQWESVEPTEEEGNYVETYTGGHHQRVPHPSQQVEGYHDYVTGFVRVFHEDAMHLYGCAYCHNYRRNDGTGLFDPRYADILERYPLYTKDDVQRLADRLKELLRNGSGFDIFNKFMRSPIEPSKQLLEKASEIIQDKSDISLLNDQILAKNTILYRIKKSRDNGEKNVVIVRGGPGTGKTVIGLHIIAELANRRNTRNISFATKSKPLRMAIHHKLGSKAGKLITNLYSFIPAKTNEDQLDVLLVDEAHRIEEKSNMQFTPKEHRTDMPQVEQVVRCAKTAVFFIDDHQAIRKGEVGSTDLIKAAAEKYGAVVREEELNSQFRCNGSQNYLDWLEATLGHRSDKRVLTERDNFDFRIFSSPEELYGHIKEKDEQEGVSARLVAGFCWPWSGELRPDGSLPKDVRIGDFAMPWETHFNIRKPPEGYVHWYEWAYKPQGIKQVGCIYTAQGFEFDYIGVIVGPDIRYDPENDRLVGDISGTKDPKLKRSKDGFDTYVKNIYRVLMSRGMKGCYVYFTDKKVEAYFRQRMESGS